MTYDPKMLHAYRPIIQTLGVMNQWLITRCLDFHLLQDVKQLQHIDAELSHLLYRQKQDDNTTHYIWRTQGDEKVRPSHAALNGRIFAWGEENAIHPGDEPNCRCWAEPYKKGKTEYAYQVLISEVNDAAYKWKWWDFVIHSLNNASDVTLSEIGHLGAVINHYAYVVEGGIFKRVNDQIIAAAERVGSGYFTYGFDNSYSFEAISYPHGESTVAGVFRGVVFKDKETLKINGIVDYYFDDTYTDPADIRELLIGTSNPDPEIVDEMWRRITDGGGDVYEITDAWQTEFHAEIPLEPNEDTGKLH